MSCSHCGDSRHETHNHNHHRHNCENPCRVTAHNTPACESLPSQIENFSTQFFGTVVKTEVDGRVVWSLPCDLGVGLPNNPRSVDEGLACYFLRLFQDGIVGLTGPQGPAGANGTNGHNAYTVTLAQFTQPSSANPNVQVFTAYNPGILPNSYVFIQDSGYYLVNAKDSIGNLFLQLIQAVSSVNPGNTITVGKLVVVAGPQGIQGAAGQSIQGPPGPQGPAGSTVTLENDNYFADVGSDYQLQATFQAVNFVNSSPQVLLESAGKHLVTVVATVAGEAGVTPSDAAILKLFNTSASSDVSGSTQNITNIDQDQFSQIVINTIITTSAANQTIALYGRASGANIIAVIALNTTVTAVRIA